MNLVCFFDGACEPTNPGGNMGMGSCIYSIPFSDNVEKQLINENRVFAHSDFLPGEFGTSNNVAEYLAFETLLNWLINNHIPSKVFIYGDSKLVVEQMCKRWKMKSGFYIPVAKRCRGKLDQVCKIHTVQLSWIPREKNKYADELSKAQLINHGVQFKIQPLSLDPLK